MVIFFRLISVVVLVSIGLFSWQVWQNNRDVEQVSDDILKQHFSKAISWLDSNYADIESNNNPILWWMINQAAMASNSETLKGIYSKYKSNHIDNKPPNLSTPMFDKFYRPRMPDISFFSDLADYQIFFFYALSCDEELGSEPIIQKQMAPGFCSMHYLHPRCITHQLMGLRFMQRYECGYDDLVSESINELQKIVVSELTWDFRVGDAYIQRVLMLVDTGGRNTIKPIWINNIMNAQNEDGSWDDLHPILNLGNDRVFALTSMLPTIQKTEGDFHATAQAIWLLSMLIGKAE